MEPTSGATCGATKTTPTANGDIEVPCAKSAGHVERGDPVHEGRVGVFPVRWTDQPSDQ
ncbi:hypothetical protein OHA72_15565 [Dactylosporangium sp. NBC_01737]|uniref:hypothetical protein n=1 Tax=Dactylosporangium sp. NBC_01737 TaxID=2975959 RepID=UPI002E157025|nr:hypothetical protein OHA72_15565 [Dactylosporangium sp. NBC_01737]